MLVGERKRFFFIPQNDTLTIPTDKPHPIEHDKTEVNNINANDMNNQSTALIYPDALPTQSNDTTVSTSLVKQGQIDFSDLLGLRSKLLSPLPNRNPHRNHPKKERYGGLQPTKVGKYKMRSCVFHSFQELKRNTERLFRFNGIINMGGNKFTIHVVNDIATVQAEQSENEDMAGEIQLLINNYALFKDEMIQAMSHDQLPSALQRLTSDHWIHIGQAVLDQTQNRQWPDFFGIMDQKFHDEIYITMSSHIHYTFCTDIEHSKTEWHEIIAVAKANPEWKPDGVKYGRCAVQVKKTAPDDAHFARLYLRYQSNPTVSRLQFVVTSRAGKALYDDLANLMDDYIIKEYQGNPLASPVKSFKAFSPARQLGRSDSAVIYLSEALDHDGVTKLVTYLDSVLGHRLAPIYVIGAKNMGNSYVQGSTIPDKKRQVNIFECYMQSNGALVKSVLIHAYRQAYIDLRSTPLKLNLEMLNQRAQYYSKELWKQLGLFSEMI